LTEIIDELDMTEEEKKNNPNYKTTGGYIKVYEYQEAWKRAWNKATPEDKELLFKLPNFDAVVFEKISGIDVKSKHPKEIIIDGAKYRLVDQSSTD